MLQARQLSPACGLLGYSGWDADPLRVHRCDCLWRPRDRARYRPRRATGGSPPARASAVDGHLARHPAPGHRAASRRRDAGRGRPHATRPRRSRRRPHRVPDGRRRISRRRPRRRPRRRADAGRLPRLRPAAPPRSARRDGRAQAARLYPDLPEFSRQGPEPADDDLLVGARVCLPIAVHAARSAAAVGDDCAGHRVSRRGPHAGARVGDRRIQAHTAAGPAEEISIRTTARPGSSPPMR